MPATSLFELVDDLRPAFALSYDLDDMATAAKAVGVPIKLLHEGEGHMVTIELRNGEIYRGHLSESEETMNCLLVDVVVTARDGRVSKMENVYIRGSQIKFMILPDLLRHSPVFDKVKQLKKQEDAKPKKPQRGGRRPAS